MGRIPDFWGDMYGRCWFRSGKLTWLALGTANWDPRGALGASTTGAGAEWNCFDDGEARERFLPGTGVGVCVRVCGRLERMPTYKRTYKWTYKRCTSVYERLREIGACIN